MLLFRKTKKKVDQPEVAEESVVQEEAHVDQADEKRINRMDINSPAVKKEIYRLEKDVAIIDALIALGQSDRELVHRKVRALNQIARLSGRVR